MAAPRFAVSPLHPRCMAAGRTQSGGMRADRARARAARVPGSAATAYTRAPYGPFPAPAAAAPRRRERPHPAAARPGAVPLRVVRALDRAGVDRGFGLRHDPADRALPRA